MFGRSLAIVIGSIGGFAVILGGIASFLVGWIHAPTLILGGAWAPFLVTEVLGLLILFTARPRIFWWPGRRIFNAILLVVLGALTWILVGGFVITSVGAVLTILAGIILPIEGLIFGAIGWRRRWSTRRWFFRRAW